MAIDAKWDTCFWYRSDKANSTLDSGNTDIVCKQFADADSDQDTQGSFSCNNNTLIKSTFLSGGPRSEKQSCELHISNIDSDMDNGFWNVEISHRTPQNATLDTANAFFELTTNRQDELGLTTNNYTTTNSSVDVNLEDKILLECRSRNGVPRTKA